MLSRFTPTGQTYPGSPYAGGGLSGVGFGVTIDPSDSVWLGNFGFKGKGCEVEPDHFSVSRFSLAGEPQAEAGYEVGGISWPQATVSDQEGNIWLANCGNSSVTRIAEGNPAEALSIPESKIVAGSSVGFSRAFGAAVNARGYVMFEE